MARHATRLTRDAIIDACLALVEAEPDSALSLRRLGDALGVDATAVYRHFRDKDDLMRAVADRLHGSVLDDLPDGDWRLAVRTICIRLRQAHLDRPALAAHVRTGPPLQDNEFALTDFLLAQLRAAGLSDENAPLAYHALIELTVGSAALDAPLATMSDSERRGTYREWRSAYASLDETTHPTAVALADHLYAGTADSRFEFALDALLRGLR